MKICLELYTTFVALIIRRVRHGSVQIVVAHTHVHVHVPSPHVRNMCSYIFLFCPLLNKHIFICRSEF